MELTNDSRPRPQLVVIGASWGGLDAIGRLLASLPATLGCPLAIVQHRGPQVSELARLLGRHTSWPVREAEDKAPVTPGTVHVAPPGYHLLVQPDGFALSTEAPVRFSRPSIDVLFESAADTYGSRLVGVVLTGANDDAARGLARIHRAGGLTMVQDPDDAVRADMPRAALRLTTPHVVAPIEGLADALAEVCGVAPEPAETDEPAEERTT
jgi:two-component system chemotaxis response regulator CheB